MQSKITVEICCGSYEDAVTASQGGADRIELNSALSLGGLTPSYGCVRLCVEQLKIPVITMIRPRDGGFCYSDYEYEAMRSDTEQFLKMNVAGIAFGILDQKKEIDLNRTRPIIELIHSYGKEAVFHRAFDCATNQERAIEKLIELHTDRVLTSGGEKTALQGKRTLLTLQEKYGTQIEILPGSGITSENSRELLRETGLTQIHASCRLLNRVDITAVGTKVSFEAAGTSGNQTAYQTVDLNKVSQLVQACHSY